jgi:hypothetical protein
MTDITRRSVLAGLVSAPLLSNKINALSKNVGGSLSVGNRSLRAYIHGAFVLDIQAFGVCLLFPKVPGSAKKKFAHEYRAGYLPGHEGAPLDPGSPLSLGGFAGAKDKPVLVDATIPLFKQLPLDKSSIYFTVTMPMPNSISPLRQIGRGTSDPPFFTAPQLKNLQYLPLALMLEYVILPGESPKLLDGSWSDDGSDPLVIHFRGEPGKTADINHNALPDVCKILKTKFTLDRRYRCKASAATNDDEKTLLELRNLNAGCAGGSMSETKRTADQKLLSSHPANCVGIVNCPTCN